jgi:hypothetical protein
MKAIHNTRIEEIERRYNPEQDMPDDPVQVTWVDYYLLEMVKDLMAKVTELKQELEQIKNQAS